MHALVSLGDGDTWWSRAKKWRRTLVLPDPFGPVHNESNYTANDNHRTNTSLLLVAGEWGACSLPEVGGGKNHYTTIYHRESCMHFGPQCMQLPLPALTLFILPTAARNDLVAEGLKGEEDHRLVGLCRPRTQQKSNWFKYSLT